MQTYLRKMFLLLIICIPNMSFAVYPGDGAVVREIEKLEKMEKMRRVPSTQESFTDHFSGSTDRITRYVIFMIILAGFVICIRLLLKRIRATGVEVEEDAQEDVEERESDDSGAQTDIPASVRALDAQKAGRYEEAVRILYRGLANRLLLSQKHVRAAHRTDGEILKDFEEGSVLYNKCLSFFTEAQRLLFGGECPDAQICSRLIVSYNDILKCLTGGGR